jgi:hypothetical protein
MTKILGLYHSVRDIGKHESCYKKIGDFSDGSITVIVRSISGKGATVSFNDKEIPLEEGMILGKNAILSTHSSLVEVSDSDENIYRLWNDSQLCIEMTVKGLTIVYFGKVHYEPSNLVKIVAHHKYRTSCWTSKSTTITIEALAPDLDIYYSYDSPIEVFEYDECGKRFSLFTLDAFQYCIVQYKDGKIKSRYSVIEQNEISESDIRRLYETYKMPFNWGYSVAETNSKEKFI